MISVEVRDDFKLIVLFENGEKKMFDVVPYLDKGIFTELKNPCYFKQVRVVFGSVEWPHEQDFSHDTLYLMSELLVA